MRKLLIRAVTVLILIAIAVGYYLYNKPHVNVQKHKIEYQLTVDELLADFAQDAAAANEKYSGKIILVTGKLASLPDDHHFNLVINGDTGSANCEMDSLYLDKLSTHKTGDLVNVKGILVGFDDLLGEVQLNNCLIQE